MFETESTKGLPVIQATGTHKINALNADMLKQIALLGLSTNSALIIDFSNVNYIDSTGFSAILTAYDFAKKNDKQFLLVGISHELMGLFKITKLDEVFRIFLTTEEAINSIEK